MPELIIPTGAKVDYRPYRDASTAALMYELQQRQVIAELGGQIMAPTDPSMDDTAKRAMRAQQFAVMAQQMGTAIAGSEFCMASVTQQPNTMDPNAPADEILAIKILLCKHPLREIGQVQVTPAPPVTDVA